MTVSITQAQLFLLVQPFIATVTGLDLSLVIQGLPNRAAMPEPSPGFAVMTAVRRKRLRTNIETWDYLDPNATTLSDEQGVMLSLQIDFYGATSGDWVTEFTTLWRSTYGCTQLAGADPAHPVCQPLYHGEPLMAPLDDSEMQYEERWTVEAFLQYNPVTTVPQDFMNAAEVSLINVDEKYPP